MLLGGEATLAGLAIPRGQLQKNSAHLKELAFVVVLYHVLFHPPITGAKRRLAVNRRLDFGRRVETEVEYTIGQCLRRVEMG